jgi:hypothetical protein
VFASSDACSQDDKGLVDLILKRLHFDSLDITYTVTETRFDSENKSELQTVSRMIYRSRGDDFCVRSEGVRILTTIPNLSKWDRFLSKFGYVPPNKRRHNSSETLVCSVSLVGGKWRQLIECEAFPGRASGITSRRGIYGDESLWGNFAMCTPTPRQFWQRVGNAAWGEFYTGVLGMPLREFLLTPGKSRVWHRGDWVVLTHEVPVPEEIDNRKLVCLDIYVDGDGFVRRIEDVNRIWHLTEEEWAAIPGLGAWEDVREVIHSVAFDNVQEDKDGGGQIPLAIKVSTNGLERTEADFDQWTAEGRSHYEMGLLSFTIPSVPFRVCVIAVERETLRMNPSLRNEDIELFFPEGTSIEGTGCAKLRCSG